MISVSCLCVTYRRADYLEKAIQCFLSQSYPNAEMVIVCDKSDIATLELAARCDSRKIKIFPQNDMKVSTLGELRNIAIANASGDYICNWDDDDWSNIDRIEIQLAAIIRHKKMGSILSRILIRNDVNNQSFLSYRRMWENTIMINRRFIIENRISYPHINSHEDYEFVNALIYQNVLYAVEDAALYIYRFTGKNTCSREHFDRLFGYSFGLTHYQNMVVANAFSNRSSIEEISRKIYSQNFQSSLIYVPYVEDRP
jgi:glycosyltransferase involved in cell wall biosynthesis